MHFVVQGSSCSGSDHRHAAATRVQPLLLLPKGLSLEPPVVSFFGLFRNLLIKVLFENSTYFAGMLQRLINHFFESWESENCYRSVPMYYQVLYSNSLGPFSPLIFCCSFRFLSCTMHISVNSNSPVYHLTNGTSLKMCEVN